MPLVGGRERIVVGFAQAPRQIPLRPIDHGLRKRERMSLHALLVHDLEPRVQIDEFRTDGPGHQMAVPELGTLAFDDLVLESVAGAVLLDQIEEALREIMRVDVDRVLRALAHAAPFFRGFYRGGRHRTYNSYAKSQGESPMEERVSFTSHGLKLAGILHLPEPRAERSAAFLVLHGVGSNKAGVGGTTTARMLAGLGYVPLRFDFRGCGESGGERGRIICKEQVEDTRNALSFLAGRGDIDPKRIAVIGQSFGAAVAVYTAGVDRRVAACISSGGWGDGAKKFRRQHASPRAWRKFSAMMKAGKRRRRSATPMMVPRYDIVPIPPRLRGNLAPGSIMEFPFEVRSEEHTSELQSRRDLVCRLLLEKKKI